MKWHYKTNDTHFASKFDAIDEFEKNKQKLLLEVPESYDTFDFTVEPKEDLSTLLANEAFKVREEHDHIRLFYSGGTDSHAVLNAFVKNKIHIDEIVCYKSGFQDADYEIDRFAMPYLDNLKQELSKTRIKIMTPEIKDYEQWYNGDWVSKYLKHGFASTVAYFRLMDQPYNFNDGALNIKGKDKPKIVQHQGKLYTYISDSISETEHKVYHFLLENPNILSKQCHLLINEFKKDAGKFNSFFQGINSQDSANSIIHRDQGTSLPKKQKHYFGGNTKVNQNGKDMYYVNEKERLALLQASPQCSHILDKWLTGIEVLRSSRFSKWFNHGRPEFGTTGILSKFYCLTENLVGTVDEMYPSGFTPDNILAHAKSPVK